MVNGSGDLDIPENSREIALHLRMVQVQLGNTISRIEGMQHSIDNKVSSLETTMNNRITNIQTSVDSLETSIVERRFKLQDILVASLLLPIIGGIIVALVLKAL